MERASTPSYMDNQERKSACRTGFARTEAWEAPRQHFLYFVPLPQGQGSFLPTFAKLNAPNEWLRIFARHGQPLK